MYTYIVIQESYFDEVGWLCLHSIQHLGISQGISNQQHVASSLQFAGECLELVVQVSLVGAGDHEVRKPCGLALLVEHEVV